MERGKPHERSQIINKLKGHIVQLSQHKFASNVVEKCLEYGDVNERGLLIEEIIGHNEGNDNLLVSQIQSINLNIGFIIVENVLTTKNLVDLIKDDLNFTKYLLQAFSIQVVLLYYFTCFTFSQ